MKAFLMLGGGLGDCFIRYFGLVPESYRSWGKLLALKKTQPCYIKAVLSTHNYAVFDFLRYHPCIDEFQFIPYAKGWECWADVFQAEGWQHLENCALSYEQPRLHVIRDDETWWQTLTHGKPYIVVHPFAGVGQRDLVSHLNYSQLDLPVFVIGGSSVRAIDSTSSYLVEMLPENDSPSVINLTGIANSRLACLLISRAAYFHGTMSAYCWAALSFGIPSTIYLPEEFVEDDYVKLLKRLNVTVRLPKEFPWTKSGASL